MNVEHIIDAAVQSRLAYDPAYRNAETAEQQAEREAEITLEEEARIRAWYETPRF